MSQLRKFSNAPIKASSVIGTKVVTPKGDTIGDIKEIVIDPRTGKVAYAVVSFGGFLSLGEKLFAIPFGAFVYNVNATSSDLVKNEYVLNVSKEQLEKAPGFDSDHWPLMTNEKWHREMHQFYDCSPYWA